MSDFFNDDFTAELKFYFLDSVIKETEKFIDLTDDKLWQRIRSEVSEQTAAWAIDAKTNEFNFFASWLENFPKRCESLREAPDLIRALGFVKAYAQDLLTEKADSEELMGRHSAAIESRKETTFLHCKWGDQDFAVPLLSVVEISSHLPFYKLPDKKAGLLGVIPYRGEAVPVISFDDHGFGHVNSRNSYFVICEHEGVKFSLQVTETDDLMSLKDSELQNIDSQSAMICAPFAKQFFIKNNRNIMVLDLEKLVA